MSLEQLDDRMFITFGKFNGHHITNIPAWYREYLLGLKWLDADVHEALFDLSENEEVVLELRPTFRPAKVKLTKAQKKEAIKEAWANWTEPTANTQDFKSTYFRNQTFETREEYDEFVRTFQPTV